jgi:hypothetical protein
MHKEYRLLVMNRIVLVLFLIIFLSSFGWCYANDSADSKVISVVSAPYNNTYGEWTAKLWEWALSIPIESNPQNDPIGKNCEMLQNGPVWFLAGTTGGFVERNCAIPSGKSILFPIINSECSFVEYPDLKTEEELQKCAKSQVDAVNNLFASIDGVELTDLKKYRISSPIFDINFPQQNIYGVQPGPTKGISDGYWVFLNPLPPGKHVIHFKGSAIDYASTSSQNFVTETKYNLVVAK